ncbi:hypothetical protein FPQ18DRAFT_335234 [Pyronema domesticum]|nr:hypothetical protein FPQ18DRAFT_335234 [Pyronema domesticum]
MKSISFFISDGSKEYLKLDLVGLSTIIGESAINEHLHTITASKLCLLPRLVPAPQTLMKPRRIKRPALKNMDAMTIIVDSSRKLDYLNYFPDILHEFDNLSGFCLTMLDVRFKRHTQGAAIKPRNWGPIAVLSIIDAMFSLVLIGLAIYTSDGTAIVAISLISLADTFTGVGCIWATKDHTSMDSWSLYFKTPAKPKKHVDPSSPEDLILRNDKRASILVRCDTSVSRNLYFNQEHCVYLVGLLRSRIETCLGICTFMTGVILLANCT